MATSRVENLTRAFDAFTKGDMETVSEFIDPNFEVDDRVVPEANPTERGPQALVENANQVREAFGDINWEPREVVELGDYLLVRVHVTAKGHHTSLPIDDDVGHVFTVVGDKAVKLDIYRTWEEARRAAGVETAEE